MDITNLAKITRQAHTSILPQKNFNEDEKEATLYGDLNIELGRLFAVLGQDEETKLTAYCKVLGAFLAVANEKKWLYLLLLSEEKEQSLANKWKVRSVSKTYLSLQQQVLKAYFERRDEYFIRAWHIFIKFGLTDLGFSSAQIEETFKDIY